MNNFLLTDILIYYFALYVAPVGVTPIAAAMAAGAIDPMRLQNTQDSQDWHIMKADRIFPEIYCRRVGGPSELLHCAFMTPTGRAWLRFLSEE